MSEEFDENNYRGGWLFGVAVGLMTSIFFIAFLFANLVGECR